MSFNIFKETFQDGPLDVAAREAAIIVRVR
jgi:hypothetical protein